MYRNGEILKIESKDIVGRGGKVVIWEGFVWEYMLGGCVVLVGEDREEGRMGVVMKKGLGVLVNDLVREMKCGEDIGMYKGGGMRRDRVLYLERLENIREWVGIGKGV